MSKISADNKDVKFPTHHYVGFQSRPSVDNVPLGFMTPDGTDKAAEKRKATVDNWARTYDYKTQSYTQNAGVSYENKPMVGFKLSREVRRYASFGNGNVKWRIEDPRGFELEISSANFAQILMLCTMEKGEIQEQLIWGRLGSENVLVPVDSDAYRAAQTNTERAAKKANLKDLKLGDKVVMQNGEEGYFMGVFYFLRSYNCASDYQAKISDKKRYVFAKDLNSKKQYNFFALATPKIAEIIPGEKVLDIADNERLLNAGFAQSKDRYYMSENSNDSGYVSGVTAIKPVESDIVVTRTTHTVDDLVAGKVTNVDVMFICHKNSGRTWAVKAGEFRNKLTTPPAANSWSRSNNQAWFYEYQSKALDEDRFEPVQTNTYGYNRTNQELFTVTADRFEEEFVSFKVKAKTAHSGEITLI